MRQHFYEKAVAASGKCIFQEPPSPFLKPRPSDAFRHILFGIFLTPSRFKQSAPCSLIPIFPKERRNGVLRYGTACFYRNCCTPGNVAVARLVCRPHIGMLRSNMPMSRPPAGRNCKTQLPIGQKGNLRNLNSGS